MGGIDTYRLVRRRTDWAVAKGDRIVASYIGQEAAEAAVHALALMDAANAPTESRSFVPMDYRGR